MKLHKKKMIAPIIISILLILYIGVYFGVLVAITSGIPRILLGVVPFAFAALMIKVCIERINEIKGGEEDDLSKY